MCVGQKEYASGIHPEESQEDHANPGMRTSQIKCKLNVNLWEDDASDRMRTGLRQYVVNNR